MDSWATIIVGSLSLIGTLCGSYFSNSKTTALLFYRIQSLEEKVNKHNRVVERMALAEKDINTAFRAIDELKERNDKGSINGN